MEKGDKRLVICCDGTWNEPDRSVDGNPADETDPTPLLGRLTRKRVSFHNTQLGQRVTHAYHALAIDERRRSFQPDLWTGAPAHGQTIRQVWFAGVHSNIGGG